MLAFVRDLMAHMEWADAVFFHSWGKSPARDHEEMRRRVGHIVAVQEAFLAVLRGQEATLPRDGTSPSSADLKARAEKNHSAVRDYATALETWKLSETVRIPWIPDPPCVITVAEALVQVAMHTQHHRGQCMTRLNDLGGEPKNVDWILWLWKQKPRGRWA
jgi:uncharacterized damage-inducible protein DinB